MPSGPPVLLTACITPEPTPLFSSDSSTSAADMAVAMAMPVPSPATAIHTATKRPLEPTLIVDPRKSPTASRTKPAATATLAPTSCDDSGRGNGSDDEPGDERQQPQARSHGGRAEHALEVLRHGEQDAEHGQDREHGEDHAPGERGRGEQRQVEQRLTARPAGQPAFPGEEADQQRHTADHHGQGVDVAPAVLAGLDQAVGQDHQPGGRGRHPDEVQARALRGAGLRHQGDDGDQGHHDDGHVDQEHPAPPVVRQQPATEDRADREGHEGGRRHDPHGLGPLLLG